MAVTSTSDLNSLFNLIYERALFVAREMNLMTNLVDIRSASGWMARKINIRPQITASSVGETQDFNSPTSFGLTNLATLTPGEIIAQVTLTDRDMDTDPNGAAMDAASELGAAISTKIDSDLVNAFSSFSTDKGDGAGNSATLENLAAANAVVRYNYAAQYGRINNVLHPYHWHDLWLELGKPTTSVVASAVANEALQNYMVYKLIDADIYTSANISIDASTDAISGVFSRPALMLDVRRAPRMETQRDASARATEINMTSGYAYGVVRSTMGVKFTADATEPA